MKRVMAALLGAVLLLCCMTGCGEKEKSEVVLATGTSPFDTGLLGELTPMFEARYPYTVRLEVVGSSQAILKARDGECDVTLTNTPDEEQSATSYFLTINRQDVMHNRFVIAGPASDPAGIRGLEDATEAFRKIMETGAPFVSRSDGSGAHAAEQALWRSITGESEPIGTWYIKGGKGMGDTLLLADESGAYVLTDKATYLVYGESIGLEIMVEGGEGLDNRYVVMEVNPAAFPDVNAGGAQAFSEFLRSLEAQEFIEGFGVEEYGEQLFYPDAL